MEISKQKGWFGFEEGRGNYQTILILRSFLGLVNLFTGGSQKVIIKSSFQISSKRTSRNTKLSARSHTLFLNKANTESTFTL